MNSLFRKERRSYGLKMHFLNSENWNPSLHPRNSIGEFIYTDGGLHGRLARKSPQAIPYRAGYRRIGPNVIKTDEIPPHSQTFKAPDGQSFLAPSGTNFEDVYDAGKTHGFRGARHNVWQYGKYDFQRNGGGGLNPDNLDNIFYSAYTDASNYAVGIYMNGAGASLWTTLAFARFAADMGSKNAGSPLLRQWQTLGWKAAEAQKLQWDKNTK